MSVLKNSRSSSSLSWSSVFFGTFRTFSRAAPSLLSFCREAKEHCCARCRNDGPGDRLMQDRGLGLEWAERRACLLAAKTERCATSNTRARRASCHEISRSISTLVGGLSSLATDLSDGPTLFTPHGAKPASRTEVAPAKSPPPSDTRWWFVFELLRGGGCAWSHSFSLSLCDTGFELMQHRRVFFFYLKLNNERTNPCKPSLCFGNASAILSAVHACRWCSSRTALLHCTALSDVLNKPSWLAGRHLPNGTTTAGASSGMQPAEIFFFRGGGGVKSLELFIVPNN